MTTESGTGWRPYISAEEEGGIVRGRGGRLYPALERDIRRYPRGRKEALEGGRYLCILASVNELLVRGSGQLGSQDTK